MDPSTEPPTREPGPKLLAFTMVTGHGLKHLYSAAFSVVFPEIKVGLGLSNLAAGALVMSRDVSSGAAAMPGGFIADRYSSKRPLILLAAIMLVAFGYLASGSLQTYYAIALAVILVGVGTSMWHPHGHSRSIRTLPQKKRLGPHHARGRGECGRGVGATAGWLAPPTDPVASSSPVQLPTSRPCRDCHMARPPRHERSAGCRIEQRLFLSRCTAVQEPASNGRVGTVRRSKHGRLRHGNLPADIS